MKIGNNLCRKLAIKRKSNTETPDANNSTKRMKTDEHSEQTIGIILQKTDLLTFS